MDTSSLLNPLVLADVAVFSIVEDVLTVLLVKRASEPEINKWALPGAMLKPEQDQDIEATARRALRDKISVEIQHLEQVGAFSGRDRDPRGWSLGVLFYALLPQNQINALVKSKVEAIEWADACRPGHRLAFDHAKQLAKALQVLRDKVGSHTLPLHLMPEQFTLTELQRACEAVLGHPLDKSVFRRRLKSSEDLIEIGGEFALGPQRPAQLYRARDGFVF